MHHITIVRVPLLFDTSIVIVSCLPWALPSLERTGHGEVCVDLGKVAVHFTSCKGRLQEKRHAENWNKEPSQG